MSFLKKERGQVLVVALALIVASMMLLALSADIGLEIVRSSDLQRAANAAALAGATELSLTGGNVSQAENELLSVLSDNGVNAQNATITYNLDPATYTVTVSLAQANDFFFARVMGNNATTIYRSANAVAGLPPPLTYALFSGSTTQNLCLNQNQIDINGSVHGNANVCINTNNGYVDDTTEASGNTIVNAIHFTSTEVNNSPVIPMPDFSQQVLEQAQSQGQVINGDYTIDDNNQTINGTIYVYGNVYINTNNVKGDGCIFATGNIYINANNSDAGIGDIAFYSGSGDIVINTNNLDANGIFYAPNGSIIANCNNFTDYGSVVGEDVSINCNTLDVDSSGVSTRDVPLQVAYLTSN